MTINDLNFDFNLREISPHDNDRVEPRVPVNNSKISAALLSLLVGVISTIRGAT